MDDPNAEVHAGFYLAYSRLRTGILAAVQKAFATYCPTCKSIVVTGHSLGAALAGLCSVDLRVKLGTTYKIEMNNFGMPRLGNSAFASDFAKFVDISWRMVHQDDIVPHLPPSDVGYHHVATEVWSKNHTASGALEYIVCDGSGEDPKCSDSVPAADYSADEHNTYMGEKRLAC